MGVRCKRLVFKSFCFGCKTYVHLILTPITLNLNVQGFHLRIYYINKIWGFFCQNLLHHLKLQG